MEKNFSRIAMGGFGSFSFLAQGVNQGKGSKARQCHSGCGALLYGVGDSWASSHSESSIPLTLGVVWEVGHGSVHSL